jgi:3-deoxy-manno-octulosonate cytidylyltransferase (CMP-KDO synthetase)
MKTICMIPARFDSTRFPGKVLADLWGKPMVQHVYERAQRARSIDEVYVATDNEQVGTAVRAFSGRAIMTSKNHQSGTDRIAEAITDLKADIIINVQADEPLISPAIIDRLAQHLSRNPGIMMATLCTRITDQKEIDNPNVVKVIMDRHSTALYFSRWAIPYKRNRDSKDNVIYYKHIGIYGYRREFLLAFVRWPVSSLEEAEKLEQLRALENGYPIAVVEVKYKGQGVDTPEDLESIKRQKVKYEVRSANGNQKRYR